MNNAAHRISRKFAALCLILCCFFSPGCKQQAHSRPESRAPAAEQNTLTDLRLLENAYHTHRSNLQVTQRGIIVKVLADDDKGARHQRFIVELPSRQRLLIAHNIDIAPRIPAPAKGQSLTFSGEYEWNKKGGVIHWTHHDPNGRHEGGWIIHQGEKYQ